MAVAVNQSDTASEASTTGFSTPSFTPGGSDRFIACQISWRDSGAEVPDGLVFNTSESFGTPVVTIAESAADSELYELVNPTATASTIDVSFDGDMVRAHIGYTQFTGVDQTTPRDGAATSTSGIITITTETDDMVFTCFYGNDATVTQDQTEQYNANDGTMSWVGSTSTDSASTTTTYTEGGSQEMSLGFNLNAAAAGADLILLPLLHSFATQRAANY